MVEQSKIIIFILNKVFNAILAIFNMVLFYKRPQGVSYKFVLRTIIITKNIFLLQNFLTGSYTYVTYFLLRIIKICFIKGSVEITHKSLTSLIIISSL